ncbi:hypothetical protein PMAYCL1PPCAC_30574, partial [Pristionchus mayeri]
MNSFYISLELENSILHTQRVLFVVSSILNVISFLCLLKETPDNLKLFRNYLLYIQILAAANDINFDVVVQPFPIYPAIGRYCKGIFADWGVPIKYSFATTIFLVGNIGASVIICFSYRHQSIVRGRFKFNEYPYGNISWIRERSNYVLYVRETANVVVLPLLALS